MTTDPKVDRALRAARRYADGGDVTTADVRRKLADTVTNRATLLPLADYADGSTRLAWPGIMYEPAAAWKRMVDEGPTAEDSFTVASAVPIAGLAAAAVRPGASLGSGGGKLTKSLPIDEASRMARAREMGFDTERTLYHGTASPIQSFDPKKFGSSTKASGASQAAWLVDDPRTAAGYADYAADLPIRDLVAKADTYERLAQKSGDGGKHWWDKQDEVLRMAEDLERDGTTGQAVMPLHVRGNFLEHDFGGAEYTDVARDVTRLLRQAKAEGYDGLRLQNLADDVAANDRPATHYAVFDPSRIRSKFAAFDPDKIDSTNILAANSSKASTPGLAAIESNRVRGSSLGGEVEVPVVPAFRDGNRYYTGLSHGDAGLKAMEAGVPEYAVAGGASSSQGFLTDRGNFVSRADALKMPGTKNMPRNMGTRNWIDSTDVNTYHGVDTMNPPWAGKVREHPLLAKVPRRPNMEIYSNTSTASVLSLMNQREDR